MWEIRIPRSPNQGKTDGRAAGAASCPAPEGPRVKVTPISWVSIRHVASQGPTEPQGRLEEEDECEAVWGALTVAGAASWFWMPSGGHQAGGSGFLAQY